MLSEQIHCNDCNSQFGCFQTVIVNLGVSTCLMYQQSTFPQWSSEGAVFNLVSRVCKEPSCFGHDHCTGLLGSKQDQSLSGLSLASLLIFHFALLKRLLIFWHVKFSVVFQPYPQGLIPNNYFRNLGVWLSSLPSNTQGYTQQSKYKDLCMGNVFCLKR